MKANWIWALVFPLFLASGATAMARSPVESRVEATPEMKQWFADIMWKKFVEQRDPGLNNQPVSAADIDDFVTSVQRSGLAILSVSITLEELTRLAKFYGEAGCKKGAFGLDLDKGLQ